ncbi:polyketide cyclase [Kaistella flava (ex Peng et al. 2021)]|uniref:Polyketide cyclase n=1 Tax=Kaistella flava (ex Peng et al. 2021) TaxID=2038776 RepID=A0A7M2Y8S2_9FLAO|nr:polyketide cyclase [Kaistella flava (ex Peng et al. 2021)]QOW10045.1 polyketide cyclase [Kaistella flava (ex Peng et al. 2021)]
MRWLKFGIIIVLFLGGVYAVSMTFVDENKNFTIEKEINYPIDKVYPQFNNLQNFARWNSFFTDNKNLTLQFYTPYEGKGSAMTYRDKKDDSTFGDIFIRYENPEKTLKLQLFEGKRNTLYTIDLKFIPQNDKTKIVWYVHTPKRPFLERSLNLISEDFWISNIDKSMKTLYHLLGNKVDKETQRESLKFDSLMVEQQDSQLLLGINVTTKNVKDALFKNIVMNHNKVLNYVKMDLAKKDDEYGEPVMINDADNFKDKEVSYFYGIPLSKKEAVSDNNFSFRTIESGKYYVIFYQGSYEGRVKAIQQLLTKAKHDTMRIGDLQQTFLEEPTTDNKTVMKLSLPVYK